MAVRWAAASIPRAIPLMIETPARTSPGESSGRSLAVPGAITGADNRYAGVVERRDAADRIELSRWLWKIEQLRWILGRLPTPTMNRPIRSCRRSLKRYHASSGQTYGYIFRSDALLETQKLRPPGCRQRFETFARSGADREKSERSGRIYRRRVLLAEEVHLGENDAVWLGGEIRRILGDLASQ